MSVAVVVEVLVAALVLFAVAAAATGRLGGLAEVPPDDAGDGLPAGPLSPADLAAARFPLAFRGYRMADVDAVLERLAGQLAERDAEVDRLRGGPLAGGLVGPDAPQRALSADPDHDGALVAPAAVHVPDAGHAADVGGRADTVDPDREV